MEAERTEAIEAELDGIVERRAHERRDADRVEELWRESARAHHEKRREEMRALWHDFHERMREVHSRLAKEHETKALALANRAGALRVVAGREFPAGVRLDGRGTPARRTRGKRGAKACPVCGRRFATRSALVKHIEDKLAALARTARADERLEERSET